MAGDTVKIESAKELKYILDQERQNIFNNKAITAETKYRQSFKYILYKYIECVRTIQYYSYMAETSSFIASKVYSAKIKRTDRRRNRLSQRINVDYAGGSRIEKCVRICHPNVILNGFVDEGCIFHGNNVLGNKSTGDDVAVPRLGRNVDVGFGALIIGGIEIADDCVIGAGAVVTKSYTESGSVIVGVPARRIK